VGHPLRPRAARPSCSVEKSEALSDLFADGPAATQLKTVKSSEIKFERRDKASPQEVATAAAAAQVEELEELVKAAEEADAAEAAAAAAAAAAAPEEEEVGLRAGRMERRATLS